MSLNSRILLTFPYKYSCFHFRLQKKGKGKKILLQVVLLYKSCSLTFHQRYIVHYKFFVNFFFVTKMLFKFIDEKYTYEKKARKTTNSMPRMKKN